MSKIQKLFKNYRYDLALEEGVGPWMVTWIAGLMVFFVTMALTLHFGLSSLSSAWTESLTGSMTVEISSQSPDLAGERERETQVQKILNLKDQHPAVANARQLTAQEVKALVEPWLGASLPMALPLPALIEISLNRGADVERLAADVKKRVPTAVIDTHLETLRNVQRLAQTVGAVTLLLTGLIVALAVASIAGIVHAKFSIHQQEVELLHLLGASDEYIARQFRRHTLQGAFKGAVIGFLGMMVTLAIVVLTTRNIDVALLPRMHFMAWQWAALFLSPILIGSLIAHLTAQYTVMKELSHLA